MSSGTGCFPFFGSDIKVGGVLERLPAHSDSFPTNLKRIIRLSGVSFKDMSISSNFKSHPKRNFRNKRRNQQSADGGRPPCFAKSNVSAGKQRHCQPRPLRSSGWSIAQDQEMSRTARRPHLLCILLLSSISLAKTVAFLATVALLPSQPGRPEQNFLNTNSRRVIQAASSSRKGALIHL